MKDANALNRGLWLGLAGIVIFAATLPLTRLAASVARANATKMLDMCGASGVPTASRVSGKVAAKITMPASPSQSPRFSALVSFIAAASS